MYFGLRIIDRYIAKEILLTWSAVMFVLLLVIMSAEFARQLSWLAEGRIQADALFPLTAISLAKNLIKILPLTMLLAILLAFGRLYKDSEMAAMMSAAMGPASWYRPVVFIALPAAALLSVMTLFVIPELNYAKAGIMDKAGAKSDLSTMMVGRFNPSGSGNAVFFLESHDEQGQQSDGIFFRQVKDGVEQIDIANSASNITDDAGQSWLVMHNGRQYIGETGSSNFRVVEYDEYAIRMQPQVQHTVRALKALPSADLVGAERKDKQAELHWRITMPVALLMLALLAVPLSYTQPRAGRYAKLAVALFIYIVYANFLGISKRWIADGSIPLWLGSWWVHLGVAALLILLLWKQGYLGSKPKKVVQG